MKVARTVWVGGKSQEDYLSTLNTAHGVYAKAFFDNSADFLEDMYDWPIARVKEYIKKNSRNGFVYMEFSYKQLGRDEEWFKRQAMALNGDLFKIKREILLQWNKSSDLSPFSEAEIIRLHDNVRPVVSTLMINNVFPLKIYNPNFDWRGNLMIGVDCASGMSRDATAIVIWDPSINEVVATFKSNTIDGVELQDFLVELIGTIFTNAILIVERNYSGKNTIDHLLRTKIAKNIFYEKKETTAEKKQNLDVKKASRETRITKVYGINTDKTSRPAMMDILRDVVRKEYDTLSSEELVNQIAGLERNPKLDRIDHAEGGHDDMVMAYLLIRYVWAFGRNLGNWFVQRSSITDDPAAGRSAYARQVQSVVSYNSGNTSRPTSSSHGFDSSTLIREQQYKNKMNGVRETESALANRQQGSSEREVNMGSIRNIFGLNR